jgi:hypothetical protein
MTKFKVYRVNSFGGVTVEVLEAYDWAQLFGAYQYSGNPIFKVEVFSGIEPVQVTA